VHAVKVYADALSKKADKLANAAIDNGGEMRAHLESNEDHYNTQMLWHDKKFSAGSDRNLWSRVDGTPAQGSTQITIPRAKTSSYGTSPRRTLRLTPAGIRRDEFSS